LKSAGSLTDETRAHAGNGHEAATGFDVTRDGAELGLDLRKAGFYMAQLDDEMNKSAFYKVWDLRIVWIFDPRGQDADVVRALVADDTELGKVTADGVDELRALTHERLADTVDDQNLLLLPFLDGTNRMVGLTIASQMAAASAASCLLDFTNGRTNWAGTRRTSWP
jgi:hypothetical protein